MPRFVFLFVTFFCSNILFGGNPFINSRISVESLRIPSRNASTEIDAAYFNPSGLSTLSNGFHISLSDLQIVSNMEIDCSYPGTDEIFGINDSKFTGKNTVNLFPTIFAVYKLNKLAISFSYMSFSNNGTINYDKGLPSLEIGVLDHISSLIVSHNATEYRLDSYFTDKRESKGMQAGLSYKINNWLSIGAGIRYVTSKRRFKGNLSGIEIMLPSGWKRADLVMTETAEDAGNAAISTTALINGGSGSLTLTEAEYYGIITPQQRTYLENELTFLGSPTNVIIESADQIFKNADSSYSEKASLLSDKRADASYSGSSFITVFSINLSPSPNFNIGIRYEMSVRMEMTIKSDIDFLQEYTVTGEKITLFNDGEIIRNDIPTVLSIGADYKLSPSLKISFGSDYYFDRSVYYGYKTDNDGNPQTPVIHISNKKAIDHNNFAIHGGIEYNLSENVLVSSGYAYYNTGVNDKYQNDFEYELKSHYFGVGGEYKIIENLIINIGAGYTWHNKKTIPIDHIYTETKDLITVKQTYTKSTFLTAVGINLSF